jgi:GntR family transcriptional regulator
MPEYQRIAEDIRSQIARGVLAPGDRLPSVAELTRRYGVPTILVRNALLLLQVQGLARGEQGRGVFVTGVPRRAPHRHPARVGRRRPPRGPAGRPRTA